MRNYIYLIEVAYVRSGWWLTTAHYSTGRIAPVTQDMWRWVAVHNARRMCRALAENQGTNLRLELQIRTKDGQIKSKDSYGADPRTIRG